MMKSGDVYGLAFTILFNVGPLFQLYRIVINGDSTNNSYGMWICGLLGQLWGISLGNEMMSTCMGALGVSDDVKSEVIKFDKIYNFYMRDGVIRKDSFISYPIVDFVTGDIKDIIWMKYNIDPWNRQFPLFFNNINSDYYNNSSNKIRYGYWLFYKDCVISSSSNRTNGVSVS